MTHRRFRLSRPLAPIVVALAGGAGAAAAEPIATDRPDFVESSDVVGAGRVQLETGIAFETDRQPGLRTKTRSTPTLLRVGIGNTLELRLETDGLLRRVETDLASGAVSRDRGAADVSVGVKWHSHDADEAAGRPGVAWLLHVDIDSGSAPFRGQGARPSLRGVAEWDLPGAASLGLMAGALVDRNAAGSRFASGILALTVSRAWSPAWRTYLELAGQQLASRRNGGSVVTLDTGVTWLLSDEVQLDLSVARGVSRAAPHLQSGVGASIRF